MIKSFKINNYRQFDNIEFDNFSNVNLFIGENDTGKTTILKFLYSITYEFRSIFNFDRTVNITNIKNYINNRLYDTNIKIVSMDTRHTMDTLLLGTDKLSRLNLQNDLYIDFFAVLENTNKDVLNTDEDIKFFEYYYKSLFIPAKEILSIMGAINYLKLQNIQSGFDDSYTDIIAEIFAPKNNTKNTLQNILKNYNLYDGEVDIKKDTNEFYYKKTDNSSYNINNTAEGIKKLGIFDILYKTNNIQKNSIIYIDEPENSLHPKMLREFMRFLVDLSKENIQIFMASHNSFVLNQLSNIAERENYSINVYKFIKNNNKTIVEGAFDLSKDFPENSITDEAYDMFVESKSE